MRTLVDIPDNDIEALDALSRSRGESRASIIRRAVRDLLAKSAPDALDEAFGLWAGRDEDGLAYQRRLRDEW